MNKEFVNYTSALWDSNLLSYAIRGKGIQIYCNLLLQKISLLKNVPTT